LLLITAVISVYLPVLTFDFTNYDDPEYVTKNYIIERGVTWTGIKWAFSGAHSSNWHPLAWISHMLDAGMYGTWGGGHHLTSLAIHAANTVILFLVLTGMMKRAEKDTTASLLCASQEAERPEGRLAPRAQFERKNMGAVAAPNSFGRAAPELLCAFVALLFGLHPMHVESVAWIAERKDVLSGFFFMLTLLFYACYVRSKENTRASDPASGAQSLSGGARSAAGKDVLLLTRLRSEATAGQACAARRWYLLALAVFACGLMSKPMLVTVPAVLVILDFWPLHRVTRMNVWRVGVLEKLPFAALAIAVCFVTVWAQKPAIAPTQQASFWFRICNSIVCCALYMAKLCWPVKLAVLYPEVLEWSPAVVIGCFLLLCAIAAGCLWQWKNRPWIAAGFAWFFVMLVPIIGVVKVGAHLIADRYTYLPATGFFIVGVWAFAFASDWLYNRSILAARCIVAVGIAAIIAFALAACRQVYFWQDSFTLFRHTIAVTKDNYIALDGLASDYFERKELRQAEECLRASLATNPIFDLSWAQLGGVLKDEKRPEEAMAACRRSIHLNPRSYGAYGTLGQMEMELGRTNEAVADYEIALRIEPEFADAHYNLANALAKTGNIAAAREHYAKAAEYDPTSADAHNNYAYVLMREGDVAGAEREFRETVRLRPGSWKAHYGLAQLLSRKGDVSAAIAELEETIRQRPDFEAARKMIESLKRH
jgi:tetratricopeptide (TPR) repeat protein